MIVIGLTGHKDAGKDTVADILVREHGFTRLAFADPLKRMVRNLDPIISYANVWVDEKFNEAGVCTEGRFELTPLYLSDLYELGYTDEELKRHKRYGPEIRRIWQRFGTECMRAEEDNYWIQAVWREIEAQGPNKDRFVFTDVRFPNEADFILDLGLPVAYAGWNEELWGLFPESHGSALWQITRIETEDDDDHSSESHVGLLGETVQIFNDGSLEELAVNVGIAVKLATGEPQEALWERDEVWD